MSKPVEEMSHQELSIALLSYRNVLQQRKMPLGPFYDVLTRAASEIYRMGVAHDMAMDLKGLMQQWNESGQMADWMTEGNSDG